MASSTILREPIADPRGALAQKRNRWIALALLCTLVWIPIGLHIGALVQWKITLATMMLMYPPGLAIGLMWVRVLFLQQQRNRVLPSDPLAG